MTVIKVYLSDMLRNINNMFGWDEQPIVSNEVVIPYHYLLDAFIELRYAIKSQNEFIDKFTTYLLEKQRPHVDNVAMDLPYYALLVNKLVDVNSELVNAFKQLCPEVWAEESAKV